MQKATSYRMNGRPKTCWGCSQPFVARSSRVEAIVAADGQLYCHRNNCKEAAFVSHVDELRRARAVDLAA